MGAVCRRRARVAAPLFIVGCGRSGTTLVCEALSTVCHVHALNEARVLWLAACPALDVWSSKAPGRGGCLDAVAAAPLPPPPRAAASTGDGAAVAVTAPQIDVVRRLFYQRCLEAHMRCTGRGPCPCVSGRVAASEAPQRGAGCEDPARRAADAGAGAGAGGHRRQFTAQGREATDGSESASCSDGGVAGRQGGQDKADHSRASPPAIQRGCGARDCVVRLPTLVEKLPENAWRIPLLAAAFPRCRILHILRDGRAVARSIARFSPAAWYGATDHKWRCVERSVRARWGDDAGLEALQEATAAATSSSMLPRAFVEWATAVTVARRDATALGLPGAGRYVECRYEDFVARPRAELERLVARCGLGWQAGARSGAQACCAHVLDRVAATVKPGRAVLPSDYALPVTSDGASLVWPPAHGLLRKEGYTA